MKRAKGTKHVRTEGEYRKITQLEKLWRKSPDFVVFQKDHEALGSGPGGHSALRKGWSMWGREDCRGERSVRA